MNVPHGQGQHFAACLLSACKAGDVEFLAQWARWDADGFAKCLGADGNGALGLCKATEHNHLETVLFMLHHVDANAATPYGIRPLPEASQRGYLRVMRLLLDHGADPNLSDTQSKTALAIAARNGYRDAVLLLLERGALVNLQVNGCPTALSVAAMEGHLEIMSDLFAAGGDPNLDCRITGFTLCVALLGRQPEAARMLLAWGADVTVGNYHALRIAADEGYADVVAQILAKSAAAGGDVGNGVNARNNYGMNALMLACAKGSESVVRVLLQNPRIDVDLQDYKYYTALMYAVCAEQAGIVETLLERGASVKPDERAESSVLMKASVRGMSGLVRLILERGGEEADVDFRGIHGFTALEKACHANAPDIAEMLLRAGAKVNTVNTVGWTPLMYAASCDTGAEMCRLLLERGADPSVRGPLTNTSPLILACKRSAPEFGAVIQALIRAGANVNAENSYGVTALQVAIDNNNKETVKTLLNSGARVKADNAQRQLVDYKYELKRDLEAVVQVFPHALASRGSRPVNFEGEV